MIGGIDKYFTSIQIQRSSLTNDSWGNPIQSWSNHVIVKGLLRQLNGNEVYSGNKDTPTSTHRMYCRLADVKVTDSVLFDGKQYQIVSVNNVMNFDELLQIDCVIYE